MAMLFLYPSKKNMRENIGKPLKYEETSVFGPEYLTDGELYGSNRPSYTGIKTDKGKKAIEFFAQVIMENSLIKKVN